MWKKSKQVFNDFSIKTKLLLLLIIASILPLLFISIYNYQMARRDLTNQAYRNVNITSQQIVSNMNDQFSSFLQTAYVLSEDFLLKDYLSKNYTSDYDFVQAYRYINHSFYNILSSNSKINNICIYTKNTTLPSDGLFIKQISVANEAELAWLKNASTRVGNIVFQGVHLNKKGENVISLGSVFSLGALQYPQGYLVIDFKESTLHSLFEKEAKEQNIFVVDSNGYIQSTQNKELLTQPISVALEQLAEEKKLVVTADLLNGWSVVIAASLNEIVQQTNQSARQTLVVSMFCIGIAFVLILRISRYFSSRFALVNEIIHRIEKNNFQVEEVPHSKDEMGQMLAAIYKMAHHLDDVINENYLKEVQRKDAELTLLQSQINPHLLYNALSGISSLVLSGKNTEAAVFTKHLSQFYKISLNQGKRLITIAEEIAITKHYIAIQNTRFKGMFFFKWFVDNSLLEKETLKLLIQPFVENIVNHAIKNDKEPLSVELKITCEKEIIVFSIKDNGIGMSKEKLTTLFYSRHATGYGILNVNERIHLHYGKLYGVSIESTFGSGTTVIIRIPELN